MHVTKYARLAACLACLAVSACRRSGGEPSCEAVVRTWLEQLEREENDPRAAAQSYALLGPTARAALEARAERATRMQGQKYEPMRMLAEGRFALRFRPKQIVSHVRGPEASVDITGEDPSLERATVRCVQEADGWKVEPDLPPPLPLERRSRVGDGG